LAARGGQVGDERREATVLVLRGLRRLGELDRARVAAAARGLRVAERTVWRWLAESDRGDIGRKPRPRFEVTTSDIEDVAYWNGNVAAFHRALRERDPLAPAPVPLARVPAGAHAGPTRRTRARGTGAAAVRYFSDQDTTIAKRLLGGGPRRTRDPGGLARWSRCQAMADIFYRRPVARSVRVGDFGGPEPGGHLRRAARCHSHRSTFWPTRRDPPCNPMGSWKGLSGNSGGRRRPPCACMRSPKRARQNNRRFGLGTPCWHWPVAARRDGRGMRPMHRPPRRSWPMRKSSSAVMPPTSVPFHRTLLCTWLQLP